ncbi:MAG: hypothetical protein AVDCRST_MAG72-2411 [uncultured Nocardioidaceae bacterium]|uniref:CSD domain-containing protein n=1 Tax=uncultured Nocardioidaceae bacterium TaxID=253824 RepID=A0A6J4MRK1_9ACTN|nr:MAG: hypothetical protein AVDCRST_MAG72-2411 [uncultured Nocardioidaceae bacterium]
MQGTVSSFDHDSTSGTVLLDDGLEVPFDADALTGTGLRFLRPGQRVRLSVTGDDSALRIEKLQILTLS